MKKSHILIVDDNKENIQVLAKSLEKKEYRLSIAENGSQALKVFDKVRPDLVLLDIMMPEMDGYETINEMKKRSWAESVPVIFLTAKAEKEDIARGLASGAVDYITKPFYEPELLLRVSTHLEIKHAHDTIARISEERTALVHILCHDLLNPVGQILMMTELDDEEPGTLLQMKPYVKTASSNAVDIIEMVRKMTSIEEGKYTPELESLSLKSLVEVALEIMQLRLKEKEIRLEIDIPEDVSVLVEKTSFINTVFNNLMTNAIKFSHPGSVIEIKGGNLSDEVLCEITDHGIGMPAGLCRDIFNIKKKNSRPGTSNEKGTGFGMHLVKRFVESYGGRIEVSSVAKEVDPKNSGTTMMIFLQKGG